MLKSPTAKSRRRFLEVTNSQLLTCHARNAQIRDLRHPARDLRHPARDLRHPAGHLRHPARDLRHRAPNLRHIVVALKCLVISKMLKSPTAKSRRRFREVNDSQLLTCRARNVQIRDLRHLAGHLRQTPPHLRHPARDLRHLAPHLRHPAPHLHHPARDLLQTAPKVYAKKNRQTPAMETRTPSTSRRRMRWW